MSKFNAKVIIAVTIVGILTWIALLVAVLWGGFDTIGVWAGLLGMTIVNYAVMNTEKSFDEAIEVIFSKEESN